MTEQKTVNRRRFLWLAGAGLGGCALVCGGGLALFNQTPSVNKVQASCGKGATMQRVLVTYATRYGSTGDVAQAIAAQLCERGLAADLQHVDAVKDLSPYAAVVIGSGIRMGACLPPAVKFVEAHRDALSRVPVAFFAVHMENRGESEESRQKRLAYLDAIRKVITPQYEGFFAGKIEIGRMALGDKLMSKMMGAKDEDLRDWAAIRGWAAEIFPN
jgi:menaquinone-dependent protoporphyrinogen oxidase